MKHVTMFFQSRRSFYSSIKNLQKCTWITLIGFLFIEHSQISSNLFEILLDKITPLVTRSELFHLLRSERCQIKHSWSTNKLCPLSSQHFFIIIWSWNLSKVCVETFISAEK